MSRHRGATLRNHQVLPRGVLWCWVLAFLSHKLITKSDVTVADAFGFFLLHSLCVCRFGVSIFIRKISGDKLKLSLIRAQVVELEIVDFALN